MKFLKLFMVLAVLALAGLGAIAHQLGLLPVSGAPIIFTVEAGENFATLAARLQAEGVIANERAFRWYVRILPPARSLKRGEFGLNRNMSVPAAVKALTEGKPFEYKVTVPEGYNLFQVADILEAAKLAKKADFLAAARAPEVIALLPTIRPGDRKPRSIEGYIYPDTYLLQRVFTAKEIALVMVRRFREVYQKIEPEMQASLNVKALNLTPHEVIVLASIVEKETGAGVERPLIASVFVNRIKKKMRLQTDPTVIYGVWEGSGSWDGNIRRKDLNTPTAYNTYQMDGLPAGPIANPGLNAIRAVLQPSETEYFFFVSRGDGTHIFTKAYADHAKAVRETQLTPGAKEGKSWRNLPSEQRAK